MSAAASATILVACIGNIFMGDDGFGSEVALALSSAQLPGEVQVVDYGIRGIDLTYALLAPWSAVVLVDTVSRGEAPGTLYLLQPGETQSEGAGPACLDPHALDPVAVIRTARTLGEVSAEIYIVGCEPMDFGDELEGRMGLSDAVEAAVPAATAMVTQLARQLVAGVVPAGALG
jgi:hydrogenase maturation protease